MIDVDQWYQTFHLGCKYVIWGCSDFAEQFLKAIRGGVPVQIAYMVDIDPNKQGRLFEGVPVYAPERLKQDTEVKILISNTYMGTRTKIAASLIEMGFVENEDFTYIEYALSIFSWKTNRKIVSQYAEISTTTYCTLNCKNCTAYMPYVEHRRHLPLAELYENCDTYFRCVDYVGRFRLLGGEPLVYPHIKDLVCYIGEKYRNQIGEFCIVTNGTIFPKEALLAAAKKYDVTFFISNYSQSGHPLTTAENYQTFLARLTQEKINYHFTEDAKWVSMGDPTAERLDDKDMLRERFEDCRDFCRSIVDGKLFLCSPWAFAVLGGLYKEDWKKCIGNGILDLGSVADMNREERFACWYKFDVAMQIPEGYLDFCRYCKGFGSKNCDYVKVGEQKEQQPKSKNH